MYAVKRRLFKKEDIQNCEPAVLIGLPRLAFVLGYTKMPDLMTFTHKTFVFSWFNPKKRHILPVIERGLSKLSPGERRQLERLLVGRDDNKSSAVVDSHAVSGLFQLICSMTTELLSGKRSQEFNSLLSRVIKMHEDDSSAEDKKV